jgi:hypothetical protein
LSLQVLAEWMGLSQRAELGDQRGVAPQRQVGVNPRFDSTKPQLVQTAAKPGDEVVTSQIGQDSTAPQRESTNKFRCSYCRLTARNASLTGRQQTLELCDIDCSGHDVQAVTARLSDQDTRGLTPGSTGFQSLPKSEHIRLDRRRVSGRWMFRPQGIRDLFHGDRSITLREQKGEHRALLRATDVDRRSVPQHLQGTEHAEPEVVLRVCVLADHDDTRLPAMRFGSPWVDHIGRVNNNQPRQVAIA